MLLIPRLSGIKELGTRVSQGSEGVSKRFGGPDVIAIEGDMLPAEGRDVGENLVGTAR